MSIDSHIQNLREEKAGLVQNLQQMYDELEDEERAPDPEEDSEWRDTVDRIDEIDEKIESLEEKRRDIEGLQDDLDSPNEDPITTGAGAGGSEDRTEQADQDVLSFRGELKYRVNRVPGMGSTSLDITEEEKRALQADIDEAGGFTLAPQQFVDDLIKFVDDELFMRQLSRVEPVEGTDSLGAPSLDQDPSDPTFGSEIGTISEDSQMDFGARELNPHIEAERILVSRKLLRASALDIDQLVRDRLAYKFQVAEEKAELTGSGANEPLGVFTASPDGISTSRDVSEDMNTDSITTDGLISCKYNLKAQYQRNADWIFHRDSVKQIRKLKDGQGQYIWDPGGQLGLTEDAPGLILNRPYRMSEYAPNTFGTGNYIGILGDFRRYWIAVSMEMEVQVLQELYAENSQVGFIGREWVDGMPVLEEAFSRLQFA